MGKNKILFLGNISTVSFWWLYVLTSPSLALPPATDTPEEVLRTEIILEGRSPVDGKALSASKYEELQADLKESSLDPQVSTDIQQLIFLLQIRKLFKTIIPFY